MEMLNSELVGMLDVSIYINEGRRSIQGWTHHYLNLLEQKYDVSDSAFSSADMTNWHIDTRKMQTAVVQHMPVAYPNNQFRLDNAGILFVAHFPLSDFQPVLADLRRQEAAEREVLLRARGKRFKNDLTVYSATEEITMTLNPGGIFFSERPDELEQANQALEDTKAQADSLSRRLNVAQSLGMGSMLLLCGYELSETLEDHGSAVDSVILGHPDRISRLLAMLREKPEDVLMELFHPANTAVRYEYGGFHNGYKHLPFSDGTYHPLRNLKDLKVYDSKLQS